jgi:hypothetical protein
MLSHSLLLVICHSVLLLFEIQSLWGLAYLNVLLEHAQHGWVVPHIARRSVGVRRKAPLALLHLRLRLHHWFRSVLALCRLKKVGSRWRWVRFALLPVAVSATRLLARPTWLRKLA